MAYYFNHQPCWRYRQAIVSRCIALIKYVPPDLDDRRRIWRVMTEQFKLAVAPELIHTLAERFPRRAGGI